MTLDRSTTHDTLVPRTTSGHDNSNHNHNQTHNPTHNNDTNPTPVKKTTVL